MSSQSLDEYFEAEAIRHSSVPNPIATLQSLLDPVCIRGELIRQNISIRSTAVKVNHKLQCAKCSELAKSFSTRPWPLSIELSKTTLPRTRHGYVIHEAELCDDSPLAKVTHSPVPMTPSKIFHCPKYSQIFGQVLQQPQRHPSRETGRKLLVCLD